MFPGISKQSQLGQLFEEMIPKFDLPISVLISELTVTISTCIMPYLGHTNSQTLLDQHFLGSGKIKKKCITDFKMFMHLYFYLHFKTPVDDEYDNFALKNSVTFDA